MRGLRSKRVRRRGGHRYVGDRGDVLGVDRFGASAPGDVVMREYGFTWRTSTREVSHCCGRLASARSLIRKELEVVAASTTCQPARRSARGSLSTRRARRLVQCTVWVTHLKTPRIGAVIIHKPPPMHCPIPLSFLNEREEQRSLPCSSLFCYAVGINTALARLRAGKRCR